MKKLLAIACAITAPVFFSQSAFAQFDFFNSDGSHKRFSVSAGWLHAAPSGDATPVKNSTAVASNEVALNGDIYAKTVARALDPSDPNYTSVSSVLNSLSSGPTPVNLGGIDPNSSTAIRGLEKWATPGTGLESDDVNTVGMLFTYYVDDNWAVEMKAGVPPKVDILGKGTVIAPFNGTVYTDSAVAKATLGDQFLIKEDIHITDMTQGNGVASTARAWLPAALVQYQFGKNGVNKFRPYVGVGVLGAYFSDIELNSGVEEDLVAAGHRIQNIKTGKAGASLENKVSNSDMHIDVEADTVIAPIINVGATYDIQDNWFVVGSISYAVLDSDTTITVKNDDGEELIKAVSNIDIDPYISYLGVGYRF